MCSAIWCAGWWSESVRVGVRRNRRSKPGTDFLIDPEPYDGIELARCPGLANGRCAIPVGIDEDLLKQRRDFLRPDSLVAIIMLSDENDCSVTDDGTSFSVLESNPMPRATSVCATDPLDACCRPCSDSTTIEGCPATASDPECGKGPYTSSEDSQYLRCFAQKKRFGRDFLQPIQRYVNGLTQLSVPRQDGSLVPNPLFVSSPDAEPRHPSLVFLAAIVGVPWQDIARDPNDPNELHYKSARELHQQGVWDIIVGDSSRGVPPTDPLMRESVDPRSGRNPVTGDVIAPPTSTDPLANPINGHEMVLSLGGTDLQYACIFDLPAPRSCDTQGFFCDCGGNASGGSKPICQDANGVYGSTQFRAKAFPGSAPARSPEGLRRQRDRRIDLCAQSERSLAPGLRLSPRAACDPRAAERGVCCERSGSPIRDGVGLAGAARGCGFVGSSRKSESLAVPGLRVRVAELVDFDALAEREPCQLALQLRAQRAPAGVGRAPAARTRRRGLEVRRRSRRAAGVAPRPVRSTSCTRVDRRRARCARRARCSSAGLPISVPSTTALPSRRCH